MTCDDCEQREAKYRVHYVGGGTAVFCGDCAQFDLRSIDNAGTLEFAERIEDGELIMWGRNQKTVRDTHAVD